jgi:hypothetical protein
MALVVVWRLRSGSKGRSGVKYDEEAGEMEEIRERKDRLSRSFKRLSQSDWSRERMFRSGRSRR